MNIKSAKYMFSAFNSEVLRTRHGEKTNVEEKSKQALFCVEISLNLLRTLHNPVRNTFFRILYRCSGLDLAISK